MGGFSKTEHASPEGEGKSTSDQGTGPTRRDDSMGVASSDRHAGETRAGAQSSNLRFVIVNEPQKPPNDTHRNAVRSHVMRNVHSHRRQRNRLPIKRYNLESKDTSSVHSIESRSNSGGRSLSQSSHGESKHKGQLHYTDGFGLADATQRKNFPTLYDRVAGANLAKKRNFLWASF
jgi:hypothetical protein